MLACCNSWSWYLCRYLLILFWTQYLYYLKYIILLMIGLNVCHFLCWQNSTFQACTLLNVFLKAKKKSLLSIKSVRPFLKIKRETWQLAALQSQLQASWFVHLSVILFVNWDCLSFLEAEQSQLLPAEWVLLVLNKHENIQRSDHRFWGLGILIKSLQEILNLP